MLPKGLVIVKTPAAWQLPLELARREPYGIARPRSSTKVLSAPATAVTVLACFLIVVGVIASVLPLVPGAILIWLGVLLWAWQDKIGVAPSAFPPSRSLQPSSWSAGRSTSR